MPDEVTLERRLRAVERTLTDGEHDVAAVREAAGLVERIETVEDDLADAHERIAELEAATQALRGYVGNVRSVNEDVERRADAALAAVERLEDQFANERRETTSEGRSTKSAVAGQKRPGARTLSARPDPVQAATTPQAFDSSSTADASASTDQSTSETETTNGTGDDETGIVQRVREAL